MHIQSDSECYIHECKKKLNNVLIKKQIKLVEEWVP